MLRRPRVHRQAGFTLLELIFVVVVAVALARYALPRLWAPQRLTMEAQAHGLADAVRRAQTLAMTRRQRMSAGVTASGTNGTFAIACTAGSCNTDTSVRLEQSVVLTGPTTVYFNSWGVPVNSAGTALTQAVNFTLSFDGDTWTIAVAPLTGGVTISH